jgi:hypothetical protein
MRADGKSPAIQRGVRVGQPIGGEAIKNADAVADEPEIPRRRDLRILLPERPGRRVPRVGERCLSGQDK